MNAMLETSELPAVFDGVKLAAVAAVLYVIVRCLNLKSPTAPPDLYFQDSGLSRFLLKSCPLLTKEYIPPLIWGKSGHIQTALYGKMGRVRSPHPYGQRKFISTPFFLAASLAQSHSGSLGCCQQLRKWPARGT
uniref:Abhydrolase domain containing 2, acylglycerol lipase n=1 Tax=Molossus molossus TaxID=27622 RepID=A0A7J8BK20_MOLMO|nr:abhydrolase domain containing 2, acylglycerol lipase [Molossus molossus]